MSFLGGARVSAGSCGAVSWGIPCRVHRPQTRCVSLSVSVPVNPLAHACRGYDAVSGLGTPNVAGLLSAAIGVTPPAVPPYSWAGPPAESSLSIAAIAGIVAGAVVAVSLATLAWFCCLRDRCGAARSQGTVVDTTPHKHGYAY